MSDLRITKGQPDDDELAALVIALGVVAARITATPPVSRWRASLRPRSLSATRDSRRTSWR